MTGDEEHPPRVAWTPDAEFVALAQKLYDLREGEKRGGTIETRTALVLSLLSPGEDGKSAIARYRALGAPCRLLPDPEGLRLDLGPDDARGIHSHIPYDRLPQEVGTALSSEGLFADEGDARECAVRIAEARGDAVRVAAIAKTQDTALATALNLDEALLTAGVRENPRKAADAMLRTGEHLSAPTITSLLETRPPEDGIFALIAIASELNGGYEGADGDEFRAIREPDAWRRLHKSAATARFSRSVFETRSRMLYENGGNADISRVLELLFGSFDGRRLSAFGIQVVRGNYGNQEFVAFFDGVRYERVLIDPNKHLRTSAVRERYAALPLLSRSDFEAFEGLLLPYLSFNALEKTIAEETSNAAASVEGLLSLLASEIEPAAYEPVFDAGSAYLRALREGDDGAPARDAFLREVREVRAHYGKRMQGASVPELLDRFLKLPERIETSFDEAFLAAIPDEAKREQSRRFLDSLPVTPARAKVVRSGTESGIPFALEARALRALKIEARPTLLLIMGAKNENLDDQAYVNRVADAVIAAGKETGANVFMQGTQSGKIAETIVRKYWEYKATLQDGAEPGFRLIAIEPGRSIYAGPDGYPNEELRGAHSLLPIDTILTPYAAGWAPGESMHTYRPHVVWRQSVIRRAAEGNPAATLVINAGPWGVAEAAESTADGFTNIVLPDSGRLAGMLGRLRERYGAWRGEGEAGALRELRAYVDEQPLNERALLTEDLALMQERGLSALIERLDAPERIVKANVDDLRETLLASLTAKE